MTNRPPLADPSLLLELRVLEGPQQGASSVVEAAQPVSVGTDVGSDIVLHGAGTEGFSLVFSAAGSGLRIRMAQGRASAAGQALAAGQEVDLPLYTPISLGQAVVAIGEPGGAGWDRPPAATQATPPGDGPHPEPAAAPPRRAPLRWSRWLVTGGGALAAASIGVLAFAYTVAPSTPSPQQQARRAEASLRAAGFTQLSVNTGANGELQVSGYLDTSAQRALVERLLAAQAVPSRLQVWVNEDVSAAVLDVFRVNGVAAQVRSTGPGAVLATTQVADAARLEPLKSAAKHDVPGLAALEVRNTPPAPVPEPAPVVDDPGKRVASIVLGDLPHVVTADGTRYFEGSLLPTGHRIKSIHDREVQLERDGTVTPLRF